MKITIGTLILLVAALLPASAQTGWGTSTPHSSAALEINSNTKGILLPRMSTGIRTGIVAAKGLLVFDTDTNTYWYYNGTTWIELVYSFENGTIGMIAAFPSTSVPTNWRVLDGSSLNTVDFPALGAVYPSWVSGSNIQLPDYRGYFLRGTGTNANGVTGGAIGEKQTDRTAQPTAPFVANSAGSYAHTGTVTNTAGAHTHTYWDFGDGTINAEESVAANTISDNAGTFRNTVAAGTHTHSLTSITTSGAHTHTISGGGDTETRPRNIGVVWAIKVIQ